MKYTSTLGCLPYTIPVRTFYDIEVTTCTVFAFPSFAQAVYYNALSLLCCFIVHEGQGQLEPVFGYGITRENFLQNFDAS